MDFFNFNLNIPGDFESQEHDDINLAQSVLVYFNYEEDALDPLFDFEDKLEQVITEKNAGIYDGHEVGLTTPDATLFMYGPNAETLFKVVKPLLESTPFLKEATAHLSFGTESGREIAIDVKIG